MDVILDTIEMPRLISLVRDRPILWDKSLEEYKYKNLTHAVWKQICVDLYPDYEVLNEIDRETFAKSVLKKWKNVKDNYFKYVKKVRDSKRPGSLVKVVKKYHFYEELTFLDKTGIRHRKLDETSRDSWKDEPTEKKSRVRKRKLDCCPHTTGKEDRHFNFFRGVLPSLQNFNEQQILRFQCGVLQLISEIQYPTWQNLAVNFEQSQFVGVAHVADEGVVPSSLQNPEIRVKKEAHKEFFLQ